MYIWIITSDKSRINRFFTEAVNFWLSCILVGIRSTKVSILVYMSCLAPDFPLFPTSSYAAKATIVLIRSLFSVIMIFDVLAPTIEVGLQPLLATLDQLLSLFCDCNFLIRKF